MRIALLLLVLLCPTLARAERLVSIPTGKKIPFGVLRLEHQFDAQRSGLDRTFLGMGLTPYLDAEISRGGLDGDQERAALDLGFNYVDPIVGFAPGVSVGLLDATNASEEGRSVYFAATYRIGLDGAYNFDTPMELTLGYLGARRSGFFAGVSMPFTRSFRILGEFSPRQVVQGLEFKPWKEASVRWLHRDGRAFWSLSLSARL